jgi:hypothetical protein
MGAALGFFVAGSASAAMRIAGELPTSVVDLFNSLFSSVDAGVLEAVG